MTQQISRSKPLSKQVHQLLLERIHSGIYTPDHRMPSEDRLAEELQVSRTTVRAAMEALAAEGYVRRVHGDGTYVNSRVFELKIRSVPVWDIQSQIIESGRQPSLQVLEQTRREATSDEAAALNLSPGEEVLFIRRLFQADRRPIALIDNTMPCNGLSADIPPDAGTLPPLEFLERYHHQPARRGLIHFKAIQADQELAHLFQIAPLFPMLIMEGINFDHDDRPISYAQEIYLGDEGFRMVVVH